MRITRADKSVLSDWWFTVDRLMFFGLLLLMGAGVVLSLAASPPIAAKYDLEPFYFVRRHAALILPAVAIMFAPSACAPLGCSTRGRSGATSRASSLPWCFTPSSQGCS